MITSIDSCDPPCDLHFWCVPYGEFKPVVSGTNIVHWEDNELPPNGEALVVGLSMDSVGGCSEVQLLPEPSSVLMLLVGLMLLKVLQHWRN